jgi:tight adherence protein B
MRWILVMVWAVVVFAFGLAIRESRFHNTTQRRLKMFSPIKKDTKRVTKGLRSLLPENWVRSNRAAAFRLRASEYFAIRSASVILPGLLGYLVRGWVGAAVLAVVGFAVVALVLRWRQRKWMADAEALLPDFLSGVANAMKAGSSFQQAMSLVAKETPAPLGPEVVRMLRRESLGVSLDDALQELTQRMPWKDLELAVMAITIQREVGGALSSILENIVATITERQRLKREIRTLTAQGRMSALIVTFLPIGIGFVLWFLNPSYERPLFTTKDGLFMLGYAVVSISIGSYIIQRMVKGPDL